MTICCLQCSHPCCSRTATPWLHPEGWPGSPPSPHRCLPPGETWAENRMPWRDWFCGSSSTPIVALFHCGTAFTKYRRSYTTSEARNSDDGKKIGPTGQSNQILRKRCEPIQRVFKNTQAFDVLMNKVRFMHRVTANLLNGHWTFVI